MKAPKLWTACLFATFLVCTAIAGEEVGRLLDGYAKIETVTCQVRRTKEGGIGKMKFLSRVYWTHENRIHSEGITPLKRRTIADGKRLWQYAEGDPKGFSRPVEDLSEQMKISLRMVPGTAMDHLLQLKEMEEIPLTAEWGVKQVGIQAEKQYVVLRIDQSGRLIGIRFYDNPEKEHLLSEYAYSDFIEAVPGVWIPLTHEVSVNSETSPFKETVKVDSFTANKPVAESLFIASSFFDKGIDFVDDFAKIYPE